MGTLIVDLDKFTETLKNHAPDDYELSAADAGAAFRNLSGFMTLLFDINNREKVITHESSEASDES